MPGKTLDWFYPQKNDFLHTVCSAACVLLSCQGGLCVSPKRVENNCHKHYGVRIKMRNIWQQVDLNIYVVEGIFMRVQICLCSIQME